MRALLARLQRIHREGRARVVERDVDGDGVVEAELLARDLEGSGLGLGVGLGLGSELGLGLGMGLGPGPRLGLRRGVPPRAT